MRKKVITSARNSELKKLLSLKEKSSARKENGLFLVEGRRELEMAISGGYHVRQLWYVPSLFPYDVSIFPVEEVIETDSYLYEKIAYRGSTEGVLGVCYLKNHELPELLPSAGPVLIMDKIEKPGNIGAMLRTADACGASLVILSDIATDLYNPNIVRSSLGTIFTNRIAIADSTGAIDWCNRLGISIYAAYLSSNSKSIYSTDFQHSCAIVVGEESEGLGINWVGSADHHIRIPMYGKIDSLNVSNAAAITLYEVIRQTKQ